MVKADLISSGNFDEITKLTREAVQTILGFELVHVGINASNEKKAAESNDSFMKYFNFKSNIGASSIFVGQTSKEIEIMKKPYLGKHGHLAIATNNIFRAFFYLEKLGLKEKPESRKEKAGKLIAVY